MCDSCDAKDLRVDFPYLKKCCKAIGKDCHGEPDCCNFEANGFRCHNGEGNCQVDNDCIGWFWL